MTFQKGQSGNPFGRPPGARGKATVSVEGLSECDAAGLSFFLGPGRGDFDTQRNRMIASGTASETDRFVSFCWKS